MLYRTTFAAAHVQPAPPPTTPSMAAVPAGVWTVSVNGMDAAAAHGPLPLRLHARDATLDGATVRITRPDATVTGSLSPVGLVFQLDADEVAASAMASADVMLTVDYGGLPQVTAGYPADYLALYRVTGCYRGDFTIERSPVDPGDVEILEDQVICAEWEKLDGVLATYHFQK